MRERFIGWAQDNDWDIVEAEDKEILPAHIRERYAVPEKWYEFIARMRVCRNKDYTKWFLTPWEYGNDINEGFRWNEFELQSLEWCGEDPDITAYWDTHLPIFRSVDGEYSYYAIDTENGHIVYGCEPEYEDCVIAADDLDDFLSRIISGEIVL